MEKLFKLKENGTNVRTEIVAGLTTFMTMAYIIALNPNIITGFGANAEIGGPLWNAIFLATVLSSGIGTILMAFFANKPFAMAPGMGLNSYFATVVAGFAAVMGCTFAKAYTAALCIILFEGIFFVILTLLNIREKIVDAIPLSVRLGIPAGIGLMLVNIGFNSNAGVQDANYNMYYMLGSFFTNGPSATKAAMGSAYSTMIVYVVCTFIGLFAIAAFHHKKVKGSVLLGMLTSAVCYWICCFAFLGTNPFASLATASFIPPFKDMLEVTFFKFDFKDLFDIGIFTAVMTIITFCMIDMFDTIGTLYGTAKRANMLDKDGNMPNMKGALMADAVGTCVGAVTGTPTVTTFIESASGVEEGGRTGLTALTTGVLFLLSMFIAPLAALIPAPATSAALIFVGVLMMGSLKEVDYSDVAGVVPVVLMLVFMMVSSSIAAGIGIGLISYSIIKILTGKIKDVSVVTMILAALFICKFFITF